MHAQASTVYKGLSGKARLYAYLVRTLGRTCFNRKEEDEAPFIPYILQKDDICLHIGATDGRHSYKMAEALKDGSGYILAFEPSPVTFPILERGVRLLGLSGKIKIARRAFSDQKKTLRLNIPYKHTGKLANNFGFTSIPGDNVKSRNGDDTVRMISFEVEATTINDVVAENKCPRVDFIRMDIEGSERLALNGGWSTIEKFKPHLLIEIHPGLLERLFQTDPQTIYDDFKKLGYDIYHLEDGRLVPSANLSIMPWKDYFFIHKDRPHRLPVA